MTDGNSNKQKALISSPEKLPEKGVDVVKFRLIFTFIFAFTLKSIFARHHIYTGGSLNKVNKALNKPNTASISSQFNFKYNETTLHLI